MGLFQDLPFGVNDVKMTRRRSAEAGLLEQTRQALEKGERAEGIHASDLMDPMMAYWKRLDPQPLSEKQILFFTIGRLLHAFVLSAVADGTFASEETDSGSSFSEEFGIWYSPDHVKSTQGEMLAEFKTSRSPREPQAPKDIDSYVEQLMIYMAAEDKLVAQIWVLYLGLKLGGPEDRRNTPAYRVYEMELTPDQLAAVKARIKRVSGSLQTALAKKDPSKLDPCRAWKCREDECPWWSKCPAAGWWRKRK